MKSFKQFLSENVNISGDFNGNLYINSQPETPQIVGEKYSADVVWNGELYNIEVLSEDGCPSNTELTEMLQGEYPGALVQNVYPSVPESKLNITKASKIIHQSEWT